MPENTDVTIVRGTTIVNNQTSAMTTAIGTVPIGHQGPAGADGIRFHAGIPSASNITTTGVETSILASPISLPDTLTDGDLVNGQFSLLPINTSGTSRQLLIYMYFNGVIVLTQSFTVVNNTAPTVHGSYSFYVGGTSSFSFMANGASLSAITRQASGVAESANAPNTLDLHVYMAPPDVSTWRIDTNGTMLWAEVVTPYV
jgi:hypothetical protein